MGRDRRVFFSFPLFDFSYYNDECRECVACVACIPCVACVGGAAVHVREKERGGERNKERNKRDRNKEREG